MATSGTSAGGMGSDCPSACPFDERNLAVVLGQLGEHRIDGEGAEQGGYLVAGDSVGAGVGETVLVIDEGGSAQQVLDAFSTPIRSVIVGIVDQIAVE